jgi:hypothetical protein
MRYFDLPGRENEPWEQNRIFAETSPDDLASDLPLSLLGEAMLRKRRHAYTDEQVDRVRQILGLADEIGTDCIRRHLDEFAIMIGMQARIEPDVRPVEAIERIERELVGPIAVLRGSLAQHGLRREFLVRWGTLKAFDLVAFEVVSPAVV